MSDASQIAGLKSLVKRFDDEAREIEADLARLLGLLQSPPAPILQQIMLGMPDDPADAARKFAYLVLREFEDPPVDAV